LKELRFHPHYRTMIATTSEDSYNIFRPNIEPEDSDISDDEDEMERKQPSKGGDAKKLPKTKRRKQ